MPSILSQGSPPISARLLGTLWAYTPLRRQNCGKAPIGGGAFGEGDKVEVGQEAGMRPLAPCHLHRLICWLPKAALCLTHPSAAPPYAPPLPVAPLQSGSSRAPAAWHW